MDDDLVAKLRDEDSYYRLQEKHWCIDAEELDRQRLAAADLIETQARENERLRRDRDDLLTFAKAIQIWRSDADSYDRECDHPQRNYCEDVELMEGCADIVVRRVTARAALGEGHD